jgi:hypothetical protein
MYKLGYESTNIGSFYRKSAEKSFTSLRSFSILYLKLVELMADGGEVGLEVAPLVVWMHF